MTDTEALPGILQSDDARAGRPGFTIHGNPAAVFGALAKAQADFGDIKRTRTVNVRSDKGNYTFAYAPLDGILAAVTPALNAAGLSFCQPLVQEGDKWVLRTILAHESGAYIECSCTIPWPMRWKDGKSYPGGWQEFGSAVTYARRYTAGPLLGIAPEEDDDGNAADGNERDTAPRTAPGPRQNTRATPPPTAPKQEAAKPVSQAKARNEAVNEALAPKESGGTNGAASPSAATEPVGKVESAPPPAGEGTWVQPSPPAAEAKPEPKKSTPPPSSGALATVEQNRELTRLTTGGERLWPQQEPDGTYRNYKFRRATLDQFSIQITGKPIVQVTLAEDAAKLIAALNKLPESNAVQRKIWADLKERFKADKEAGDAFCVALIGKPASWVCSPEEAAKLAGALAT